ncbi:TPA: hypothetical protein DDW35_01405 [Candidatus Sumerlaeota bacterium]|jgi:hypothetical protein|nr:hypothetical protein [Candidatus Sumerlaeota bacterium]
MNTTEQNLQTSMSKMLKSLHRDQTGAVMLELVIVLPLLAFLLFFILFLQHIQHYEMNASLRYRVMTWEKTVPTQLASGQSSSDHDFIRIPVQIAPVLSGHLSVFALERYFSDVSPYQRLFPLDNHDLGYFSSKAMRDNTWGRNLAAFARYFSDTEGWDTTDGLPDSHDGIWLERFALTTNPWQHNFEKFEDLAIFSDPVAKAIGYAMLLLTALSGHSGTDAVSLIKADATDNAETRDNAFEFITDRNMLEQITQ